MTQILYLIENPNDIRTWELPTYNHVTSLSNVKNAIAIEEDENGNIYIENYTCIQTGREVYSRISNIGKKLASSNWIKRFTVKK